MGPQFGASKAALRWSGSASSSPGSLSPRTPGDWRFPLTAVCMGRRHRQAAVMPEGRSLRLLGQGKGKGREETADAAGRAGTNRATVIHWPWLNHDCRLSHRHTCSQSIPASTESARIPLPLAGRCWLSSGQSKNQRLKREGGESREPVREAPGGSEVVTGDSHHSTDTVLLSPCLYQASMTAVPPAAVNAGLSIYPPAGL